MCLLHTHRFPHRHFTNFLKKSSTHSKFNSYFQTRQISFAHFSCAILYSLTSKTCPAYRASLSTRSYISQTNAKKYTTYTSSIYLRSLPLNLFQNSNNSFKIPSNIDCFLNFGPNSSVSIYYLGVMSHKNRPFLINFLQVCPLPAFLLHQKNL